MWGGLVIMEEIENSFKTLSQIATQIDFLLLISKVTYENGDILDNIVSLEGYYAEHRYSKAILSVNLNNVIVFANSYLEEFNKQLIVGKFPQYADRIITYRRIVSPALKRIEKWTDLRNVRNELLVHNYRVKGTSIFSTTHQLREYNAPFKDQEILLLGELILLINKQLIVFFPDEIKNILGDNDRIIDKYKATANQVNFREEITTITKEVENLKKAALNINIGKSKLPQAFRL